MGTVNPLISSKISLNKEFSLAQIDFNRLLLLYNPVKKYQPFSSQEEKEEDLCFIFPSDISVNQIINYIYETDPIIYRVSLIDAFNNQKTFRVVYKNKLATGLNKSDVQKTRRHIIERLNNQFNLKLKNYPNNY